MGTLADIETALFTRVASLVLSPALTVAWPNVEFTPPTEEAYLQVDHLPNNAQRLFLLTDDPEQWIGILQITVVSPTGQGSIGPSDIADLVSTHFKADTRLIEGDVVVDVTKDPDIRPAAPDGAWWRLPIDISYQSFN